MTIQAGEIAYVTYGYEDPTTETPVYFVQADEVRRPPIDVPRDDYYYFKHTAPRHKKYVFTSWREADKMVDELVSKFGGKPSTAEGQTIRQAIQLVKEE